MNARVGVCVVFEWNIKWWVVRAESLVVLRLKKLSLRVIRRVCVVVVLK